jgi:hypothetical protein
VIVRRDPVCATLALVPTIERPLPFFSVEWLEQSIDYRAPVHGVT